MEDQEKPKAKKKFTWKTAVNAIFWILIFIILLGVFHIIQTLRSAEAQCLDNGFVYAAANQMEGEVSCSCTEIRDGESYPFGFNETSWWAVPVEKPIFSFTP